MVEYIARTSVMPIDGGWAFKFDTDLMEGMSGVAHEDAERNFRALSLPFALLYGEESELFSGRTIDYMRSIAPAPFEAKGLAAAHHHLFLDQPLGFVELLAAELERLRA